MERKREEVKIKKKFEMEKKRKEVKIKKKN
jgi:hypothetical protein